MTRRGKRVSRATIFFAVLSIALAIALYLKTRPSPPAPPAPAPTPAARTPRPTASPRPRTPAPRPTKEAVRVPPGGTALAAIVIDDLGNELAPAERIAAWKAPVAGAVLPGV